MKKLFKYFSNAMFELNSKKSFFLLLVLILFLGNDANSQLKDKSIKPLEKDFFFIDPIVFYNKDQQKAYLDLYLEIPLENLQFKKNYSTKLYDASINYVVKITNSINEVVTNESISDFVSTTKDEQKKLEMSSKCIVKEFFLNPGNYTLEVTINDINTKKEKSKKAQLEIEDFAQQEISFSDIMLVSNLKQENGKKVITPLIDKNIDNLKELYFFFEVYNSKSEDVTNNYSYKVIDKKNNIVEKGNYTLTFLPGINKFFEKIPTNNLVFGDYIYEIEDVSNGQMLAQKQFNNKMNGIPINSKDLKTLINQLLYIATGEELDKIKNAPTDELKEKYFIEFWRSKDPSPNTTKNELLMEYYKRITIANERYSHYVDGWKTDMGMVYIIFGEPSNIERYPFTEDTKPYEIWDFYSVNRKFVFVDDTGFGDYKLTIPIWDEDRTQMR